MVAAHEVRNHTKNSARRHATESRAYQVEGKGEESEGEGQAAEAGEGVQVLKDAFSDLASMSERGVSAEHLFRDGAQKHVICNSHLEI